MDTNYDKELCDYIDEFTKDHPERKEIFEFEKLLIKHGVPYHSNFWETVRGGLWGEEKKPEELDWESDRLFLIEIGTPTANQYGLCEFTVCFYTEDKSKLEVLDMLAVRDKENVTANDGLLYVNLSADAAWKKVEKFLTEISGVENIYRPEARP